VTSKIEHAAILETCRALATTGTKITYLAVNREGIVAHDGLLRALQSNVTVVSIMAANNVVGTVQPIDELARLTKLHGVLFHTDAVQAGGKIPLDVHRLQVDLLSLSAHKLHGPKGIGALYVRKGVPLSPIVFGGGQERGLRSATENVAGIVGFGAAAAIANAELTAETQRLSRLREYLTREILQRLPSAYFFGHPTQRLPGHLSFGLQGHEGRVSKLLAALDDDGFAVSAGSACSANHAGEPSGVLLAMGYDAERARGLIRVSLGRFSSEPEVASFLEVLPRVVNAFPLVSKSGEPPRAFEPSVAALT
jgi:cysteine desulfurase